MKAKLGVAERLKDYRVILVIFILVIGGVFIGWTARVTEEDMQAKFIEDVQVVAQSIDVERIATLSGSEKDLHSPDYVQLKDQLTRMRCAKSGVRFLYLMGQHRDGVVFFSVCSLPPDHEDYSPPGQLYTEIPDSNLQVFDGKREYIVGPLTDRWGTYMNAMVPIKDPQTGDVVAVIGMDIDTSDWNNVIIRQCVAPVLLILLALLLVVVVVVREESARALRKSEKELRIAKQKAEVATEVKSEFLANMSHEIRTPMNAILGFTEILMSKITDEQHREYLSTISSSGESLLRIINDILDISRIEAGKLELHYEAVNQYTLFDEIKQMFYLQIKNKGLDFQMDVDPDLPELLVLDGMRLRQILINLFGNAVKFTESGYIKLSVYKEYKAEDHSKLDLIFSVQDTGIGIPDDRKKQIFDAFKQQDGETSVKYGGTGLGLSITKRLTEMMGGEILLQSEVGKGSTFSIRLKDVAIASVVEQTEAEKAVSIEPIIFENPAILIVDDVDSDRFLLRGFLKPHKTNILEARNGKEAVHLAKRYKPDVILMDAKMPVMDGYEATRIIKGTKDLKAIPVIGITAYAMRDDENKVWDAGCDGYLKKPVSRNELISELMSFLTYTTTESAYDDESGIQSEKEVLTLTPEVIARLPDLLHILKDRCVDTHNKIKASFNINEMEAFAKEIKELGVEYQLNSLTNWADKLFKQANSFDIDKLPETLDYFPVLINEITETCRRGSK